LSILILLIAACFLWATQSSAQTLATKGNVHGSAGAAAPLASPVPDMCQLLHEGGSAASTVVARRLPHDPRLVVFPYHKDQIYPIQTLANRFTHIELEAGEKILTSIINDETEWEQKVLNTGSDVAIRSRVRGATGSLTIITDRRRYQIDLLDTSACPNETRYQRVSWIHTDGIYEASNASPAMPASSLPSMNPEKPAVKERSDAASITGEGGMTVDLSKLNGEYLIEGDDDLKPESVVDDGVRTWIKFRAAQALRPVLFAVAPDGTAEAVEYAPRGTYFVIGRVFEHGALMRHGKREVRIRNKSSSCGWFDSNCRNLKTNNLVGQP
jgi:type IV secretory pathway VirB9-like protein